MREHGGDLAGAARDYGIAQERWLDLSTGINPHGYPVSPVPPQAWRRLPSDDAALASAAAEYYGTDALLPVAGTQAAIQALPRLRQRSRVLLPALTYNEYAHAWRRHGHEVCTAPLNAYDEQLAQADVLVVCNPNNPTAERIAPQRLLAWQAALAARGGWLVVDEAYLDATPEESVARFADRPGLIVLRSAGKFFGLAGARVGFACAQPTLLDALREELGPWTVSGPAQFAVRAALRDRPWQARTRIELAQSAVRLQSLLAGAGVVARGTALFLWWQHERAPVLHEALAREAVLTRVFRDVRPAGIRIGLPGAEEEWARLDRALARWKDRQCA